MIFRDMETSAMATGSHIPFIDNILVGDQSVMPDTLKHDKANNKYYIFPLSSGCWECSININGENKERKISGGYATFFFHGYCHRMLLPEPISVSTANVTMPMPDRSMPLSGSVSGVLYLWDLLQKKMDSRNAAIIVTAVCPVRRSGKYGKHQNWDDHDRADVMQPLLMPRTTKHVCP